MYLVNSRDHGRTWSKPVKVDAEAAGTHVQPHLAVTSPGNVDIAWYGTDATGEPNGYCEQLALAMVPPSPCKDGFARFDSRNPAPPLLRPPGWNVVMAQSANALDSSPTFTQVPVSTGVHYGEICTNSIVCGASDRSLLDFLSIAVDCSGKAHIAFSGNTVAEEMADFHNGGANIHVANQVAGSTIAPPSACGSGTTVAAAQSALPGPPAATAAPTEPPVTSLPSTSPAAQGSAALPATGVVLFLVALAGARRRPGTAPTWSSRRTGGSPAVPPDPGAR